MKKTLLASASILVVGCMFYGCSDSGTTTVKVQAKPPSDAPKIDAPDQKMKDSLKANTTAPPDAPKKKAASGG